MAAKKRVLFVCVHNSARSQIAEAFLRTYAGDTFKVESAGLEAGVLNPIVVEAMKEVGLDISSNKTKEVYQFLKQGKTFHYVVTVCDEASAELCPIFPGVSQRMHWSFADPSSFTGSHDIKLAKTREVRDLIKSKVMKFIEKKTKVTAHGTQV